jgi:hypothetical protein
VNYDSMLGPWWRDATRKGQLLALHSSDRHCSRANDQTLIRACAHNHTIRVYTAAATMSRTSVQSEDPSVIKWRVVPEGLSEPTGETEPERPKEPVPTEQQLQEARDDIVFNENGEVRFR